MNLYGYVMNDPVNFVDLDGRRARLTFPQGMAIPPGMTAQQMWDNIVEAWTMDCFEFYDAVKSGGKWDFKRNDPKYEDFGNYHFGVMVRANGWYGEFAKNMAGAYQIYSDTSKPGWGYPGVSPYGDDPRDQVNIDLGINDYNSGHWNPY